MIWVGNGRGGMRFGVSDMVNDDCLGARDQLACVAHLGVEESGADDRVGGDFHGACLFEERFEGEANGLAATPEYSRGMGVAIDRGTVRNAVVVGNVAGTAPAEEFELDGLAVGMLAYITSACMPRRGRSRL